MCFSKTKSHIAVKCILYNRNLIVMMTKIYFNYLEKYYIKFVAILKSINCYLNEDNWGKFKNFTYCNSFQRGDV